MTQSTIDKYKWYHRFDFGNGLRTPDVGNEPLLQFIESNMRKVDFKDKSVIDIGCRDGRLSILAESLGARRVVAVDNDMSKALTEVVIPHFKSKVMTFEANLIKLCSIAFNDGFDDAFSEDFDIVMLFGVLYHLRYPVYGLKRAVDLMKDRGLLLIETAIYAGEPKKLPMMFCPYELDQPYEKGSVSYFNEAGLEAVLDSLGCSWESEDKLEGSDSNKSSPNNVYREFFVFRKTHETPQYLREYWDGVHCCQSAMVENSVRGA